MTSTISRWQTVSTVLVVVLAASSALLGLFRPGHYTDPASALPRWFAQDLVILLVAVPVLALGLWSARRGSLRGRIVWLGALAFMTYVWATVAAQVTFNQFFLGYIVLFGLSLFTLVSGVVTSDPRGVRRALDGRLSRPLFSGFLAFVAVVLAVMWLSGIVPETVAGTTPLIVDELGPQALFTHVLDLGVVVPSMAIAAWWLWTGHTWGDLFVGVLLVFGAILGPSITAMMLVDTLGDSVTVTMPMLLGSVVPPLLSLAFAVRFLLAMGQGATAPAAEDAGLPS